MFKKSIDMKRVGATTNSFSLTLTQEDMESIAYAANVCALKEGSFLSVSICHNGGEIVVKKNTFYYNDYNDENLVLEDVSIDALTDDQLFKDLYNQYVTDKSGKSSDFMAGLKDGLLNLESRKLSQHYTNGFTIGQIYRNVRISE